MVLGEAFYHFHWNLLGASFCFIVILTLKRTIFLLNSILSYFNGGLSFVVFSIVELRRECQYIMWNNKEIPVDNKPVFYKKNLFEQDIIFVNDLLFELDTTNSFTIVSIKTSKINYLHVIWTGLCHSVPTHLKKSNCLCPEISLILTIDNKEFDILKGSLIKRIIAQCLKKNTCVKISI